jgi:hypothetical protein
MLALPPAPAPDPQHHSPFMAELIDSVGRFSYPDPVLPPRPIGEPALRRGLMTLATQARATWSETAQLRREIATLEAQVQDHRQAVQSLLNLFARSARPGAESHEPAPSSARGKPTSGGADSSASSEPDRRCSHRFLQLLDSDLAPNCQLGGRGRTSHRAPADASAYRLQLGSHGQDGSSPGGQN